MRPIVAFAAAIACRRDLTAGRRSKSGTMRYEGLVPTPAAKPRLRIAADNTNVMAHRPTLAT